MLAAPSVLVLEIEASVYHTVSQLDPNLHICHTVMSSDLASSSVETEETASLALLEA